MLARNMSSIVHPKNKIRHLLSKLIKEETRVDPSLKRRGEGGGISVALPLHVDMCKYPLIGDITSRLKLEHSSLIPLIPTLIYM